MRLKLHRNVIGHAICGEWLLQWLSEYYSCPKGKSISYTKLPMPTCSTVISDMATSRCSTPVFRGWLRSSLYCSPSSPLSLFLDFRGTAARERTTGVVNQYKGHHRPCQPGSLPASLATLPSRQPPYRHLLAITTTFVSFYSPSGRWYRLFCRFYPSPLDEIDHLLLLLLLHFFPFSFNLLCAPDGSRSRPSVWMYDCDYT